MCALDPRFLLLISVPLQLPTNKILKKTSLDLSSFLGFSFDRRPIKFQIHSYRGNIVEINAKIRAPQGPTEKRGGARATPAPPVPPPMVLC